MEAQEDSPHESQFLFEHHGRKVWTDGNDEDYIVIAYFGHFDLFSFHVELSIFIFFL